MGIGPSGNIPPYKETAPMIQKIFAPLSWWREVGAATVALLAGITMLGVLLGMPGVSLALSLASVGLLTLIGTAGAMRAAFQMRLSQPVSAWALRGTMALVCLSQMLAAWYVNPVERIQERMEALRGAPSVPTKPEQLLMAGITVYVPPGPNPPHGSPPDLTGAMHTGIQLMESMRLDQEKCGGEGEAWKRCVGDYLLAAVHTSGEVKVVEAYEGRDSQPDGFEVQLENDNARRRGVNVPFDVTSPAGWTVVALRTAVYDSGDPTGVEGAVYVPYSTKLNTPDVRHAGLTYLTTLIERARTELDGAGVTSAYFPGVPVTEIGTPEHVLALILTEQMEDDRRFERGSTATRLTMLNRTLTLVGANGSGSYRFTRSRVGAAGIAQIMPGTYKTLRTTYPKANLPEDALEGRTDHDSSIKAMILHADNEWWAFASEEEALHRAWLRQNPGLQRLVLAAGYNASIKTVDRAIHACGDAWREESCTTLPEETRRYLVKYEWVYNLLYNEATWKEMRREYVSPRQTKATD